MRILRRICTATMPILVAITVLPVAAQNPDGGAPPAYPAKPVRIITGGPGTLPDIITRRLGQHLTRSWGQSVVVDNRGGAGLVIGTGAAARAAPDGYTLLVSDRTALAAAPAAYKEPPYNSSRDFAPITLISRSPILLVVHPSVPVKAVRELIDYARKYPGKLTYSAAGPVTGNHIAGEMFKQATGVDLMLIQYKGGAAAMLAVVSGEVATTFSTLPVALPVVAAGKVKALAIASGKRYSGLPDIPTVAEAGVPGFEADNWNGLLAPARTPPEIIAKVNRDAVAVLRDPEVRKSFFEHGSEIMAGTPEDFARFIITETERMKRVIDAAGIRVSQ